MDLRKTRLWGDSLQSMVERANKPKGTLIGHINLDAPARAEHSTRLLPIESVLLAERDAREAKERLERKTPLKLGDSVNEKVELPTNGTGALLRRGLIVALVLAIGGFKFYARTTPRAAAAVQTEPVAEVQRPSAPQPAPEKSELVQPTVSQRQAVDALASGDFQAAQRAYANLAQGAQGRSAYSEAARILNERALEVSH